MTLVCFGSVFLPVCSDLLDQVLLLELTRWTGKKTIQDMWCEVECGEHEYSTKVVRWNRQPTWNELLCFPVTDPGTEILRFIIIDDEILRDDMIVGRVTLALTGTDLEEALSLRAHGLGSSFIYMPWLVWFFFSLC